MSDAEVSAQRVFLRFTVDLLATIAHVGATSCGDNIFSTNPDEFRIGSNGVADGVIMVLDGGVATARRRRSARCDRLECRRHPGRAIRGSCCKVDVFSGVGTHPRLGFL